MMNSRLKRKFIPWLVLHIWEFKFHYFGALICLYILQELQSAIPQKIRQLTSSLDFEGMGRNTILIFIFLALGILIFRTLSRLLFFYPARVQQKYIRLEILEKIERVSFFNLDQIQQGRLFQVLFDDVSNLRAFVGFGLLQIFNIVISAIVLIPKINSTDSYLWVAFTPLFLSIIFFTILTLLNQKIFAQMLEKKDEVQQFLIETYEAKQTVKNFHKEDAFIKKFNYLSQDELKFFFKTSLGYAFTVPYIKLGLGASLIWAAILIKSKGGNSSDLVFFAGFLYLFLEPVIFLSWVAIVTSQGLSAWKRIKDVFVELDFPTEKGKTLENKIIKNTKEKIEVELNYWEKPLQFSIYQSKWLALIGETGSGKTYLLTQLSTSLKIKNISNSMVQQIPYLFNGTVEENIFLGREASQELKQRALELFEVFQLDSIGIPINDLMSLEVGENGKRLSGGQIKRIALIRSLLSDVNLFIWDDPFSSLDIILEKRIISYLRTNSFWSSKTFVLTSHRLTAVRLCDQLIQISPKKGIIIEADLASALRNENVETFFREQMVEYSLDQI